MKKSQIFALIICFGFIGSMLSIIPMKLAGAQEEKEWIWTLYMGPFHEPGEHRAISDAMIKEAWAEIGVNVVLLSEPWGTWVERIYQHNHDIYEDGGWDIENGGWGWKWTETIWFEGCYAGNAWVPNGWNRMHWANARADDALRRGNSVFNMTERIAAYKEWQKEYMADPPMIDMYYPESVFFYQKDLQNVWPKTFYNSFQYWTVNGKTEADDVTVILPRLEEEEATLNTMFITGDVERQASMYSALVVAKTDEEGKVYIGPDLAESWEAVDDGMAIIFHLRKNALWHDGEPVTAKDVKLTYDALLDPETNSLSYATVAEAVDHAEIIDDYTVKMHLTSATPLALTALGKYGSSILPWHILKDVPHSEWREHWTNTERIVGSGPFKFKEWIIDQHLIVEAFDDYYEGRPFIDQMIWKVIPDYQSQVVALKTGEIHTFSARGVVPEETVDELKQDPNLKYEEFATPGTNGIKFNLVHPFLNNKYVRLALAHATPKERIIEAIGWGQIGKTGMSPNFVFFDDDLEPFPYDIEKAKELLAYAGYEQPEPVDTTVPVSA
jgi:ABC-type transport system substrate-binding protein